MKKLYILPAILVLIFCSCFEDKGNYDYREVAELNIENVPNLVEVLSNAENIVIKPKITSSMEGEIAADNPNFEYYYRIEKTQGGYISEGSERWVADLNPSRGMYLDTLATFAADTYLGWFTVKDLRTGIETSKSFTVRISSTIYEGWMVLCDEGDDQRVRMDMVSVISAERTVPAYDVLSTSGLPEIHGASQIGFYPNMFASPGDVIHILSREGGYKLNKETFKTGAGSSILLTDFIIPPTDERVIAYEALNGGGMAGATALFSVTQAGNAYAAVLNSAGAAFESPINTSSRGGAVEYRVAPYIGMSLARPGNGSSVLFYDIDNKRFVGWVYGTNPNAMQILSPLPDPEQANKKFSFNTGMELVYMESTRYSNGLVYAILQDDGGKRHIYGINMVGNAFAQEALYEDIQATDFDKAEHFAFHSQFPFLFYSVGNKVYLYHLSTKVTYPMENISLGTNEEVTMLKFNLYREGWLTSLNNQSEEFMARQFELMVGSYDNSAEGVSGGKLGFYPVDGVNNTVTKRAEFTGFARIKDVVYRERR